MNFKQIKPIGGFGDIVESIAVDDIGNLIQVFLNTKTGNYVTKYTNHISYASQYDTKENLLKLIM